MNLHVLGRPDAFLDGLAVLAREAGHAVTWAGADAAAAALRPDLHIIGAGVGRGDATVEALLEARAPLAGAPQWLAAQLLHGRHVAVVTGAHGKTSIGAMLAWILDQAGLAPGFLLCGVPVDFGRGARLGRGPFVIAADAHDSALLDTRPGFVHYRPDTVVLNDLDLDVGAPEAAEILRRYHELVRHVPGSGRIVVRAEDAAAQRVLDLGCWCHVVPVGARGNAPDALRARGAPHAFDVLRAGVQMARVEWPLIGAHNQLNALAAMAAAEHIGVPIEDAGRALASFHGVRRRLELCGAVPLEGAPVKVYDDLAADPTAMRAAIDSLRSRVDGSAGVHRGARVLAVLAARADILKAKVLRARLPWALEDADLAFCHAGEPGWNAAQALRPLGGNAIVCDSVERLVEQVVRAARAGDHVVCLGDTGEALRTRVLDALARRAGVTS